MSTPAPASSPEPLAPRPAFAVPTRWWWLAWLVVIGAGFVVRDPRLAVGAALLGAGIPGAAAVGLALRRLRMPAPSADLAGSAAIGVLVAIPIAIVLEVVLPGIVIAIVAPLRDLADDLLRAPDLERLFYSPLLIVLMIDVAIVAPLAEEITKPLAAAWFRTATESRQRAFVIGMAGGAGFAFIENLIYATIYLAGWSHWSTVLFLRGLGGALHPLGAGLVALGWYEVRRGNGRWSTFAAYYFAAVGLHALWNGSWVILGSALGDLLFDQGPKVSLFSTGIPVMQVVLLGGLSLLFWRLLYLVTGALAEDKPLDASTAVMRPRTTALVAAFAAVVAVAVGGWWGPLLDEQIRRILG